jgi:hypothetical protein
MPSKYKSYNKRTLIDVDGHVGPILKDKCVLLPRKPDPINHPDITMTSDGKLYQTMPNGALKRIKSLPVPEGEIMVKLERRKSNGTTV